MPDSEAAYAAFMSDNNRSCLIPSAQLLFLHFWQYQVQDEQRQWLVTPATEIHAT